MKQRYTQTRRRLLQHGSALLAAPLLSTPLLATPLLATPLLATPGLTQTARASASAAATRVDSAALSVQVGDVLADRALIWARADQPARMYVETALDANFSRPVVLRGPHALDVSDLTARIDLTGLPADQEIFFRVLFEYLRGGTRSAPVAGRFRTGPATRRDVRFVWGGDTAGQGFGINVEFGGMKIYEAMRQTRPDFFIHSGDTIYADGPIAASQPAENGRIWHNLVTPEVSKVAETLDEYRGRYRYNLLDANVARFNAEVPQIWQWDDHEVMNNWSSSKDIAADDRYTEKSVPLHIARASRAFLEYAPMRPAAADDSERVYRRLPYGELLDVFVLDMRSYRGGNSYNRQTELSAESAFLGTQQLAWLKHALRTSTAVWKVIAADMPLGLQIADGKDSAGRTRFENLANGDGPPLGRELELADLLSFMQAQAIHNVVWLTADVHYCAAHEYAPERAQFKQFDAFWEFVAGPLNAGSFGPAALDDTFGPRVAFHKPPPAQNSSPFAGFQFFGQVDIDARTAGMTVQLKDLNGAVVHTTQLQPHSSRGA